MTQQKCVARIQNEIKCAGKTSRHLFSEVQDDFGLLFYSTGPLFQQDVGVTAFQIRFEFSRVTLPKALKQFRASL